MKHCRFRNSTAQRIVELIDSGEWAETASKAWMQTLKEDPLVAWLLTMYGIQVEYKAGRKKQYSVALARYIHHCTRPDRKGEGVDAIHTADELMEYLVLGITKRMKGLRNHIDQCIKAHGSNYVLIGSGDQPVGAVPEF